MGATKLLTAAGGGITLDAASTATDKTITIPARTGNMAVDGPAFSAYASATQNCTGNVHTKLTFDTEEFDTNSNFASSRFQPTVAGYYQINANAIGNTASLMLTMLYKTGAEYKRGGYVAGATGLGNSVSSIVYLNGSTDYVEVYVYTSVTTTLSSSTAYTYFNGALVRAA